MKSTLRSVAAVAFAVAMITPALAAPRAGSPVTGSAMGPSMRAPTASATGPKMHTASPQALGQPNQSCGSLSAPNTPGNAAMAPGSAFNPDGNAGTRYAGELPQNSRNPAAVSQYDSACAHQTR
ncbi:MAG TPA: hypothetical protein VN723_00735 [Rhizomicrobium sp.]|nr:hypothetical protein [Rhizomicrobium sp.]